MLIFFTLLFFICILSPEICTLASKSFKSILSEDLSTFRSKMFRQCTICLKNPVIFKQGQGMFSHQLKRILNKKSLHRYNWDPLPMYNPRVLAHSNRIVDHDTYEEKYDPHWNNNVHLVPDQEFYHIPVPSEYKDAYWWRDLQARRVQCPVAWVHHRMHNNTDRHTYDFQDLAFRKKFQYSFEETISNAKDMRS